MEWKLRFVCAFIMVLVILLPFKTALALVVNTPIVLDSGQNHGEKLASFSVLKVERPKLEGNLPSNLNSSLENLPIKKNETSMGMQAVLNSAYLNAREFTDDFPLTPIPTSVLLLGSGLIGLIGIARRSLFTR